jgi:hypothetical protein
MPQYYLDSPNFATATAVYANATLTVLAPDGYYSSHGIVRSQVGGQLSAYAECESCKGYQKPVEGELFLDLYPGAAAAYSLNQLNTSYSGAAIRVRRASDSTEQDIGFTEEFTLDTAALDAFCTGTNGFVAVWYDQSGNANHATQTTTAAQPKIYDAATGVNLQNALPALLWDGANDVMKASLINNSEAGMILAVITGLTGAEIAVQSTIAPYSAAQQQLIRSNSSSKLRGLIDPPTVFYDGNTTLDGSQKIITHFSNGSTTAFAINGIEETLTYGAGVNSGQWSADNTTGVFDLINIGANLGGTGNYVEFFDGTIQEIIIYPSDQSANRAGIESNINQAYNIYWDGTVTALLDDYQGAAAAYSVRALNSFYTGPLLRVRRESDNAERDIRALYNGELDTSALASFSAGTNAYVAVWYDQSGNANHATQTTAASQPKIYDAATGVLNAPTFNGSTHYMSANDVAANFSGEDLPMSQFAVINPSVVASQSFAALGNSGDTQPLRMIYLESGKYALRYRIGSGQSLAVDSVESYPTDTTQLVTYVSDGIEHAAIVDGSEVASGTADFLSISFDRYAIGALERTSVALFFSGEISALIVYNADKSADRTAIETALNDYFNIY